MFLNKININTGGRDRIGREHVSDQTLSIVAPWLQSAPHGQRYPLPAPFSNYESVIYADGGGLVVTVYAGDDPIITMGVAQRSRHGKELWSVLLANFDHAAGIERPSEPWLAVSVHPALIVHPESAQWLADFEQCVAWAWITRNRDLEAV